MWGATTGSYAGPACLSQTWGRGLLGRPGEQTNSWRWRAGELCRMVREKVLGRELALDGQTGTRAGCVIAWTPRPCTGHAGRPVAMGLLKTGPDLDVGLHKRRLKMGLTLDPIK